MPNRLQTIISDLKNIGLSQVQIAAIVGTTPQQINKLKGKEHLSSKWIEILSKKLAIPPEDFLRDPKNKNDFKDHKYQQLIACYESLKERDRSIVDAILFDKKQKQ